MEYNRSNKDAVKHALQEELAKAQRGLEESPTLRERVLDVKYLLEFGTNPIDEDTCSMRYSTKKTRKNGGNKFVGELKLEKMRALDEGLWLVGWVYRDKDYMKGSSEFERVVHNVAHRFAVPLYFNLSR